MKLFIVKKRHLREIDFGENDSEGIKYIKDNNINNIELYQQPIIDKLLFNGFGGGNFIDYRSYEKYRF
jgi:hypothetical protein